jgi:hypothetical protein
MERDDDDQQLSQLLQTMAPPVRDPLFRIKVLERRERRAFIRRVAVVVGTVAGALIIYGVTAGQGNPAARSLGIAVALAMGAAIYVPALVQMIRGMGK